MPPVKKFKRDDFVDKAYEIARLEGLNAINARRIGYELGCSVQPIFHNFSNMDELKKCVYEKICEKYREYMTVDDDEPKQYKKQGMGYIMFARDYPNFFKELMMMSTKMRPKEFVMADGMGDSVIRAGQKLTGLSYEEQKKFHIKVWIFTHGLACLIATKTINLSLEEIESLLEDTVREMMAGNKIGGGK